MPMNRYIGFDVFPVIRLMSPSWNFAGITNAVPHLSWAKLESLQLALYLLAHDRRELCLRPTFPRDLLKRIHLELSMGSAWSIFLFPFCVSYHQLLGVGTRRKATGRLIQRSSNRRFAGTRLQTVQCDRVPSQ
jgi:hypothetical protein